MRWTSENILTRTATFTCAMNSLINFDELTFDTSLNFPHYIQIMKVKMRSKVSLSNFYGPRVKHLPPLQSFMMTQSSSLTTNDV